jgi:hypothetical protein
MAKVIAITDLKGELLGVLRADPQDIGNGVTIQAVPFASSSQLHHVLEVDDDLMGKPAHEVHNKIRHHLGKHHKP